MPKSALQRSICFFEIKTLVPPAFGISDGLEEIITNLARHSTRTSIWVGSFRADCKNPFPGSYSRTPMPQVLRLDGYFHFYPPKLYRVVLRLHLRAIRVSINLREFCAEK